jgi:dTDP-4-amino-4,6-dideoxygalactose transaminase
VIRTRDRDAMRAHLAGAGVASAIHYPKPIHLTEAYAHLGMTEGSLPVAERLAGRILSLPVFPGMTEAELKRVVSAVESFARSRPAP